MARALRIERARSRYHVTARGNERKPIYRDDADRTHFLELVGEDTERFGLRIHAYVLMDNHFHLLLETPEANLSRNGNGVRVSGLQQVNFENIFEAVRSRCRKGVSQTQCHN